MIDHQRDGQGADVIGELNHVLVGVQQHLDMQTAFGQTRCECFCAVRLNYVHGGVLSWDGAKA
ncbi:MAG: hypothetical protein AAGL89_18445, partial [Pseudomonadota bacterium]